MKKSCRSKSQSLLLTLTEWSSVWSGNPVDHSTKWLLQNQVTMVLVVIKVVHLGWLISTFLRIWQIHLCPQILAKLLFIIHQSLIWWWWVWYSSSFPFNFLATKWLVLIELRLYNMMYVSAGELENLGLLCLWGKIRKIIKKLVGCLFLYYIFVSGLSELNILNNGGDFPGNINNLWRTLFGQHIANICLCIRLFIVHHLQLLLIYSNH